MPADKCEDQPDVISQNMMPSEDITKLETASPGLGRSSSSGGPLWPTSMYDPDQTNIEYVYDGPLLAMFITMLVILLSLLFILIALSALFLTLVDEEAVHQNMKLRKLVIYCSFIVNLFNPYNY